MDFSVPQTFIWQKYAGEIQKENRDGGKYIKYGHNIIQNGEPNILEASKGLHMQLVEYAGISSGDNVTVTKTGTGMDTRWSVVKTGASPASSMPQDSSLPLAPERAPLKEVSANEYINRQSACKSAAALCANNIDKFDEMANKCYNYIINGFGQAVSSPHSNPSPPAEPNPFAESQINNELANAFRSGLVSEVAEFLNSFNEQEKLIRKQALKGLANGKGLDQMTLEEMKAFEPLFVSQREQFKKVSTIDEDSIPF